MRKVEKEELSLSQAAIAMVAAGVAIIMAPAAYNRQTGLRDVTEVFVRVCTRLLLISMVPLAMGVCLDFYLIAGVIYRDSIGAALAAGILAVFIVLWFLLPRGKGLQRMLGQK